MAADRLKGGRAVNESLKLPDNLFVPGQGDTPEYIDDKVLARLCESEHPADLAAQLSELDLDQLVTIFSHMSPECCADVLTHMDYEDQREIAKELSNDVLALAITRMSSDDRVDLLQSMPEESSEILLRLLATTEREDIRRLSSYEEDTAGALMTSEYATLSPGLTARQAIDKLRLEAPNKETIYYSYVIDSHRRLLGLVSLRELILARPTTKIEKIMRRDPSSPGSMTTRKKWPGRWPSTTFWPCPLSTARMHWWGSSHLTMSMMSLRKRPPKTFTAWDPSVPAPGPMT